LCRGGDRVDNFLVILGAGAGAFIVAFAFAALSSERVRRQGLFGALGRQVSRRSRYRNPYKG
jgi:hypothetical protein